MNKVVIVGGGYGGAAAAKELDSVADVVLIESTGRVRQRRGIATRGRPAGVGR